jgi:hypothetical protein
MPDRIIAMLNRPGELISQSNFKQFHTAASDTYRSLHSFCNHSESGVWSLKSGVKGKSVLPTPDSRLQAVFYMGDKSY